MEMAAGLRLSEIYYWDLNERTRGFQKRIQPKVTLWPNLAQAGDYSCTLHYLKAVADIGPAAAKADGAATVARMKAMPTDDDCFGPGRVREGGGRIHPAYLFEVKRPSWRIPPGCPVDPPCPLDDAAPSLHRRYSGFIATTSGSVPWRRIATIGLALSACAFRFASPPKVPAVQRKSLKQDRAASMPDATWPVSRYRPD